MENRYAGDAGDFGKFGLLRALVRADSTLRLGINWYLFPDEGHNSGGKHTAYLGRSSKNDVLFRACDEVLYDKVAEVVRSGRRHVAAFPGLGILPPSTVYFEEPLDFADALWRDRPARRAAWMGRALDATAGCDIVMLDPDNGLEGRVARTQARAGKYVYIDEIAPMLERGQSVILYQHLDRSAPAEEQIERRALRLVEGLGLGRRPHALRHRMGSSRVYYIIAQRRHEEAVGRALHELTTGPWSRHFERPFG